MQRARHLAPKSLSRNQVHALIRAVQRYGSKRDLAIAMSLRYLGVRVGELVGLRLGDVSMSECKGRIVVRWGKGGRYRVERLSETE